jgi:hypothetical protein
VAEAADDSVGRPAGAKQAPQLANATTAPMRCRSSQRQVRRPSAAGSACRSGARSPARSRPRQRSRGLVAPRGGDEVTASVMARVAPARVCARPDPAYAGVVRRRQATAPTAPARTSAGQAETRSSAAARMPSNNRPVSGDTLAPGRTSEKLDDRVPADPSRTTHTRSDATEDSSSMTIERPSSQALADSLTARGGANRVPLGCCHGHAIHACLVHARLGPT